MLPGSIRYTPELADEICERIAAGEALKAICRDKHMPDAAAVRKWVVENRDGFSLRYARARDLQIESWSDELVEIADDGTNDWMQRNDADNPGYQLNGEHVQRSKLRSDNRKWLLSKLRPDKYGDRTVNEHVGDPDNPIKTITRVEVVLVSPANPDPQGVRTIAATDAVQGGVGRARQREIALLCERLDSESDS